MEPDSWGFETERAFLLGIDARDKAEFDPESVRSAPVDNGSESKR